MWTLGSAVALAGMLATIAAFVVALTRVDFHVSSLEELAAACQRYGLFDLDVASIVVFALGSVGIASVALTGRSLARQVIRGWRFERRLIVLAALPGPGRAFVTDDRTPYAVCVGLRWPRIYVSRGALEVLGEEERAAVLAHEEHHARRRDPLRLLLARALGDGLFFAPIVRRLTDRYAALAELAADEAATAQRGGRRALASALLAFDTHPSPAGVGIAPERVDHLLGERARWELPGALLLGGVATIGALIATALRMAEATAVATIDLPMLLAQLCMLVMALGPLVLGAVALLGGRRLATLRRQLRR